MGSRLTWLGGAGLLLLAWLVTYSIGLLVAPPLIATYECLTHGTYCGGIHHYACVWLPGHRLCDGEAHVEDPNLAPLPAPALPDRPRPSWSGRTTPALYRARDGGLRRPRPGDEAALREAGV